MCKARREARALLCEDLSTPRTVRRPVGAGAIRLQMPNACVCRAAACTTPLVEVVGSPHATYEHTCYTRCIASPDKSDCDARHSARSVNVAILSNIKSVCAAMCCVVGLRSPCLVHVIISYLATDFSKSQKVLAPKSF